MKKVVLNLTDNDYRALKAIIDNSSHICDNGCVYYEMQQTPTTCSKCPFTLGRHNIEDRFE